MLKADMKQKYIYTIICLVGFMLFPGFRAMAQQNTLKGLVLDAYSKKPVSAAQINVRDKKISAVTDANGVFTLQLDNQSDVLLINAFDYNPTEVSSRGNDSLVIYLNSNKFSSFFKTLETETGTKSSSLITNSIKVIDNTDKSTATTPDDLFQEYLAADVRSISRSGASGIGSSLFIRGLNSINLNAQPMFVVDGIIWTNGYNNPTIHAGFYSNPLNYINVRDIESISVLKDGAALYGSKAANGVIIIKTKRSYNEVTKIDLNISYGTTDIPGNIPMMNGNEFRTYASDMLGSYIDYNSQNGVSSSAFDNIGFLQNNPANLQEYNTYHNNTDWSKEVYNRAFTSNYQINVSGGDSKQMSYLSLGYTNTESVVKNTNMQRYNFKLNSDLKLLQNLTMGVNIGFSRIEQVLVDDGINPVSSPTWMSRVKAPFLSPYHYSSTGEKTLNLEKYDLFAVGNPAGIIDYAENNTIKKDRSNITLAPVLKITPKLTLSSVFDYSMDKINEGHFTPLDYSVPHYIENKGTSYNNVKSLTMRNTNIYSDSRITYETIINADHHLKAILGFRYITNSLEIDYAEEHNTGANYNTLINGSYSFLKVSGANNNTKSISNFANFEYDYNNKYLITAAMSKDASSRFGKKTKEGIHLFGQSWGLFPSVQGAWVVSSENFMKNIRFIDYLKIRAGISITGNDDIPDYESKAFFSSNRFMDKANGLVLSNLENNEIQWETTTKQNLGAEINLFRNRVSLSADIFNSNTRNLIVQGILPYISGLKYYFDNSGTLNNKGYELAINFRLLQLKNIQWELGASVGHYKNKITSLPNGNFVANVYGAEILMAEGQPAGMFYGYKTKGVFATQSDAEQAGLVLVDNNHTIQNFTAGDIHFEDTDNNHIINSDDKQIIGNPNPDMYGSVYSKLSIQKFTLSAVFSYSIGNDVYNYYRSILEAGNSFNNQTKAMLNRWTADGQITNQPKATYADPMGNARFSDRWIEDGSYLRLKSLKLDYSIDFESKYIKGLTVWCAANNLFTITKYLGLDPEFSAGNSVYYQGIDAGLLPQTRSYHIGVKIGL